MSKQDKNINWNQMRKMMNDKKELDESLHKACKRGHTKGVVIIPGSPRYIYCPTCSSESAQDAEKFYKELDKVQPKPKKQK